MAITFPGTATLEQTNTDGSFSITIPSDADAVIVCATGFDDTNSTTVGMCDELNFDNGATQDFTVIAKEIYAYGGSTNDWIATAYIMLSTDRNWPGAGSKTLYHAGPSYAEGKNLYVFYLKGIDLTDAVGASTDTARGASNPWNASLTGVGVDDVAFVLCYDWQATSNVDPTSSGQTALVESSVYNNASLAIGYEVGGTTLETTGSYTAGVAWFIKARGNYTLSADSGSHTVTGTAVELQRGLVMPADSGSYSVSGTALDLNYGRILSADSGSYAVTGTDATLTYAAVGNYTLSAGSGSYAVTGADVELQRGLILVADSGSYTVSGTAVELQRGLVLVADSGSYSVSGTAVDLFKGYSLTIESGAYTQGGTDVDFLTGRVLSAESGSYVYNGANIVVTASGRVMVGRTMYAEIRDRTMLAQFNERKMVI